MSCRNVAPALSNSLLMGRVASCGTLRTGCVIVGIDGSYVSDISVLSTRLCNTSNNSSHFAEDTSSLIVGICCFCGLLNRVVLLTCDPVRCEIKMFFLIVVLLNSRTSQNAPR
jgi:hypothetical protein